LRSLSLPEFEAGCERFKLLPSSSSFALCSSFSSSLSRIWRVWGRDFAEVLALGFEAV
jgi:hypothetical protein